MTARLVIAGTQSGAGKTTVTAGILRALADRGLRVASFKVGPDYIDPHCHRWATGSPGRNLDTWLMTPEQVVAGFQRGSAGAEIAIIEGVMGMYDGASGRGEIGSTAYLAKLLQAPILLVIDARASARSAAAVALGFKLLDPAAPVAGVICNRVGSDRHAAMIAEALAEIGLPLFGALHTNPDLKLPEDRLGLALTGADTLAPGDFPSGFTPPWVRSAAAAAAAHLDLDGMMRLARSAPDLPPADTEAPPFSAAERGRYAGLRLAIGLDAAFWFYYQETFELLYHWGVDPVFFSPIRDAALPAGADGLYLGGGFPERHAERLAANTGMRKSIREAVGRGLPVLGECGGYLYLLGHLTDEDGTLFPMAGAIPGTARLQPRLQGMGYRTMDPPGIKGHLFHYTRVEEGSGPPAGRLFRASGEFEREDGFAAGSILASYLHVHHATQPGILAQFLTTCREWSRRGENR